MDGYVLSAEAEGDIRDIWRFFAEAGSSSLADRMEEEIFDEIEHLVRWPGLGHLRGDLTKASVFFHRVTQTQFLIVYRKSAPLQVVAVIHAKRNVAGILRGR